MADLPGKAVTPPRNQGKRVIGLPGVVAQVRHVHGTLTAKVNKEQRAALSAAAPAGAVQAPPRTPCLVQGGAAVEPPTPAPQEHIAHYGGATKERPQGVGGGGMPVRRGEGEGGARRARIARGRI